MIDTPIRSFFDTTLRTVLMAAGVTTDLDAAAGGQVAWPGTNFDSTLVAEDTAWYRPTQIVFDPTQAGIGTLAQNRFRGIYQVDVFGPATGNYTEQDVIDLLAPVCAAFKRGVRYSNDPVIPRACVTCNQSWIFHSGRDTLTARWMVSARVKWVAYLDN